MSNLLPVLALAVMAACVYAEEEKIIEKKPIEISANDIMVRPFIISDFKMEIALVASFAIYFFVWLSGKNANLSKAKSWLNGQIDFLEKQFALVGDKQSNDKSILMKDGPADYLLYTTGRRNVQFGHWWLKLKPRNDLLTLFTTQVLAVLGYVKPAADRIVLNMALDKSLSEKFVFAVIKKDLSADLYKNRFDLRRVAKIASSKIVPESFVIYSETQKLADLILNSDKIGSIIRENADRLESLIISSLPAEEPDMYDADKHINVATTFLMPKEKGFDPYVELVCELPDAIAQLRLPGDVKSKINKNREELVKEFSKIAEARRAEELAKKKAEAKRAEEEKIKKLTPSEQRKWEEKERVRNMKKQQKKKKV